MEDRLNYSAVTDPNELRGARGTLDAARKQITDAVQTRGDTHLNPKETERFRKLTAAIEILDQRIEDRERSGRDNPKVIRVAQAMAKAMGNHEMGGGGDWSTRAARAIWKANGEKRAVTASSIDIPTLVQPNVVPMDRPGRLVDLLVNRQTVPGNAFEFFRQTTRTNNAAVVADAGTKPTSTFTVTPVEDRCRVIAHLSEPVPNRLLFDHDELRAWLDSELREGLLDALEDEVLSGAGTGEHMTGIINTDDVVSVDFDTSVPKTLRGALAAAQVAGVAPNAWVVHPNDVATLDLMLETSSNAYLLDGYVNGTARSANVFGGSDIQRVVSPSVTEGTALLADWSKARLYVREDVRIDLDPFTEFSTNRTILRAEMRVGFAVLRPESFSVIALTSGDD